MPKDKQELPVKFIEDLLECLTSVRHANTYSAAETAFTQLKTCLEQNTNLNLEKAELEIAVIIKELMEILYRDLLKRRPQCWDRTEESLPAVLGMFFLLIRESSSPLVCLAKESILRLAKDHLENLALGNIGVIIWEDSKAVKQHSWKFTSAGDCKVSAPENPVLRHAAPVDIAASILSKKCLEPRPMKDQYTAFPLVWFGLDLDYESDNFSEVPVEAKQSAKQNRYGSVVFKIPSSNTFESYNKFLVGTRQYKYEFSKTLLLTKKTHVFAQDDGQIIELQKRDKLWPSNLSYSDNGHFTHPECAVDEIVAITPKNVKIKLEVHYGKVCVRQLKGAHCHDCQEELIEIQQIADELALFCKKENVDLNGWLQRFPKEQRNVIKEAMNRANQKQESNYEQTTPCEDQ